MALKAKQNVIISTQEQFLHALREKTPEVIKAEWNKLAKAETYPSKAFDDEEAKAAKQHSALRKNRYKSIECNDNERVKVDGVGYFHGNAVKDYDGKKLFIATQGPTEQSMKDFWKVIMQEHCKVIVMLCEVYEPAIEDGKEVNKEKSSCYWPVDVETPINFGDFHVNFKSSINRIYLNKEKEIQEVITKTRLEIVDT